ncbi:DNA polymerase/3'-5' exonuclease PolX [Halalkalibaculum sp. DA384]|uniref:DNA polymerase/3'-5' exonuclease PolX n=1 Tax=Halalkalibaculum sp. DA384 TaxID=3373606 RepID=UPI003753F9FB
MYKINKELAEIFSELSAIYRFKGEEHRFRVTAYQKAATVLEHLQEDIRNYMTDDQLEEITGIGESIAEKIREYVKTGKIKKYEKLKKEIPPDFIELLDVKGLGPQTLKTIWKELNITTRAELVKALEDGRVEALEGFREKSVQNILEGLNEQEKADQRILLADAIEIADWLVEQLSAQPGVIKVQVAGSIRRGRETIGDIDLLVSAEPQKRERIIDFFAEMEGVRKVIAKGDTKVSMVIDQAHRQVDMRIIDDEEWGAALLYFTGSKEHNVHLRTIAKDRDLKINEYGLYESTGKKTRIAGKTEESIYKKLGLTWIPPELRENTGEIEQSAQNKLPTLVTVDDIKGEFHTHSKWSDGLQTIEEMARYARDEMSYSYMVLTDHSKSSRIAGGLNEQRFLEQFEEIDQINQKMGGHFIKKGVEVDILPDGKLDLEDSLLEQMDWVAASIHSHFNRDNTDRILAACESPFVNAIGHPSGRLIGKRKAYPLDIEKVIAKAVETGTALEINAQPQRMDISGEWAKMAIEKGVMLVIGTDAHDLANFKYMSQGVTTARRGWCQREHIINTREWNGVEKFVTAKREALGVKSS